MSVLILVVDDEPDVELLFRQRFRHDLKAERFLMEFAQSGSAALQRITDVGSASLILILSDINMPGMSGLELLPKARAARPDVPDDHDYGVWRRRYEAPGVGGRRRGPSDETDRFWSRYAMKSRRGSDVQ